MKKLGTLFGADLLIDSGNELVITNAEKTLNTAFRKLYPIKTDQELYDEVMKSLHQ